MGTVSSRGASGPDLVFARYWVGLASAHPMLPLLTPDFLRYNDIVPGDWEFEVPVFLGDGFREISFRSGLTVRVDGEDVGFEVPAGDRPYSMVGFCNDAVGRLLEVLPNLELSACSTNFQGHCLIPDGCPGIMNIGTPLDDVLPVITHRSEFIFSDREVYFNVSEVNYGGGGVIDCLDFHSLNKHSLASSTDGSSSRFVKAVLDGWKDQLDEFVQLATGFYDRHIII